MMEKSFNFKPKINLDFKPKSNKNSIVKLIRKSDKKNKGKQLQHVDKLYEFDKQRKKKNLKKRKIKKSKQL